MIYIEPFAGTTPVVQVINSARSTVDLNGYLLDDRKILNALRAAHARGVRVRVMIEGKPYGMSAYKVRAEATKIRATGATVKYAPPRFESQGHRWAFDHGKWVCTLHACEIGTANFSYAGFHDNREYLYVTQNAQAVQAANAVFNADWLNRSAPAIAHKILVVSPGSEQQLLQVINQPGPVAIETEEMGYAPAIMSALEAKGAQVRMILPSTLNREDKRNVNTLRRAGVQVRLMSRRPVYMHAKIIVGSHIAFIGSENFTDVSMMKNREMGVLVNGSDLQVLQNQFDKDWSAAG
jgi:phosphatidylserine/phosphatidylglycerophosphate/cardiolipin synthase-like enzyme